MNFYKKTALITGAGSGIGEATAKLISQRGGNVVVADLRAEPAESVALSIGGNTIAVTGDVSDMGDAVRIKDESLREFGSIDILINCAGVTFSVPFIETSFEQYKKVMEVNADGVWNMCSATARQMLHQGGGVIVNVSSVAAQRGGGLFGTASYAASKGAVTSLSKALARELAPQVRCNVVYPSLTLSEMGKSVIESKAGGLEAALAITPMKRPAEVKEVAELIAFLASDEASYITGGIYHVDGGVGM